jgi:histidinol dehydrogenase
LAANRIRSFIRRKNKKAGLMWMIGKYLGQKVTPLDRVGIYVPGGLASYPSSVLMNALPAHVAGYLKLLWWFLHRMVS